MPADPLALLLAPRETLRVFDFVAENPKASPDVAVKALGVSHHTWYAALRRLDGLQLVVLERAPGGKKVRRVELTVEGREVRRLLARLRSVTQDSIAVLEADLETDPPRRGSPEAGEMVTELIHRASGRGDDSVMERIAKRAEDLGRPGEAALARGVKSYNKGDAGEALPELVRAVERLEGEKASRSYRRALFYQGAVFELTGQSAKALASVAKLRKLSQEAGDLSDESDARLAYGIMKCKRGLLKDGLAQFEKALECARRAGDEWKQSKVLNNMALAKFLDDQDTGMEESIETEEFLRRLGGRIALVHMHNNRALMFAVKGLKAEARAQMREGRRLAKEVGFERGDHVRDGWERVVARLVRDGGARPDYDWREEIMQLLAFKSDATPPGAAGGRRPPR